ncbi:MAG: NosD domain-containing protein [Thermoplasmata archaeon]
MKLESKTTKSLGLRNGRDNTRGFTNGLTNGFTNGNGYRNGRKLKESRSHGKILAVFVLAMLVLSVVAVLTWESSNAGAIKIDGSFEDWQSVAKTPKERDFGVPENIDIEEYATAESGKNVAFYAKVYGNLLAGDGRYIIEAPSDNPVYVANQRETAIPNVNGRDVAYVFVDTDNNAATGFKPSPNFAVGADKAIEIVGKNGKIEASRVLTFAGVVQQEWTWVIGESVAAATNGKQVETMAGKSMLGVGENYAVYFYMIDWQNMECKLENALRCENAKSSMFNLYLNGYTETRTKNEQMDVKEIHTPIHIIGDLDFANQAQNEGWPGDGSPTNPYVIQGYEIDAGGGRYCIWIENTNVYFEIRNCTLHGATDSSVFPYGSGVVLQGVQNGTIVGNTVTGNNRGIYFSPASNNTVRNNNIFANSLYGIFLVSSNTNILRDNNITDNINHGIYLSSSNSNTIAGNNVSENLQYGIYMLSSQYNNLSLNTVWHNSLYGIIMVVSKNNNLLYNWILNNMDYGVYIATLSNGNTVHHNNFIANRGAGKGVYGNCQAYDEVGGNYWYDNTAQEGNYWSNWDGNGWGTGSAYSIDGWTSSDWYPLSKTNLHLPIHITSNSEFTPMNGVVGGTGSLDDPYIIEGWEIDAHGKTYSIWIENTNVYFIIRECNLWNATDLMSAPFGAGIALRGVQNGKIESNRCNNSMYGIYVYSNTMNCQITKNDVSENIWFGIDIDSSGSNTIAENSVYGNDVHGVYLSSASGNTMAWNYVSNNYNYGIVLDAMSNNNIIRYNKVDTNKYGVYIYSSNSNIIIHNWFNYNKNYGVYITYSSTGNVIHHNHFVHNNDPVKGYTGNCQAYDSVGGNIWYDSGVFKGNYWSNWDGNDWGTPGAYPIYGGGGGSDWYPISSPNFYMPIHITNNAEFTYQNGVVAGSGTQSDPYIIEGWEIDAEGGTYCIWIENTDAYFVIRNTTLLNATTGGGGAYGVGIELENVQNGIIENNTCTGLQYGIYMFLSRYNTVTGNTLSNNFAHGMYLESSDYNEIRENSAAGNIVGVSLIGSTYNTVIYNRAVDNSNSGIYLSSASNNTIASNDATNNSLIGICFFDSDYNTISENNVSSNQIHKHGLYLNNSHNNTIINNIAVGNSNGFSLYNNSNDNNITGNNISQNYEGIYLYDHSCNNKITYNWFCNNEYYAVYILYGSAGNIIHHNNFIGNNGAGKGVSGNCQAYDSVGGNSWYDNAAQLGNYWSNWDSKDNGTASAYPIDGGAGASDWYPLGSPVSELSAHFLLAVVLCVLIGLAGVLQRKR